MNELGINSEGQLGPSNESRRFNQERLYGRLLEEDEEFGALIKAYRGKLFRLPDRKMSLDHTENSEFKLALHNTEVWKQSSEAQRKLLLEAILSDELMEDPVLLDIEVKKKELKAEEDRLRLERVYAREAKKDEVWPRHIDIRSDEEKMRDGDLWPTELDSSGEQEKS